MSVEQEIEAFNIVEAFGDVYKVFSDESWKKELPEDKRKAKVWSHELRGKYGVVYPTSTTGLMAYTDSLVIAGMIKRAGFKIYKQGDYETLFKISPDQVSKIAPFLKLKKKRFLSPERRKAQIAVLEAARQHQKTLSRRGSEARILPATTVCEEMATPTPLNA